MNRRKFIKSGALLVPAFSIFVPKLRAFPGRVIAPPPLASGPAPCTTLHDSQTGDIDKYAWNSVADYFAFPFTAGGSYTCCDLASLLYASGSPTGTIRAALFTGITTSTAGTQLGGSSNWTPTTNASTITSTHAWLDYGALPTPVSITSASNYFFVINASTNNGTNYVNAVVGSYTSQFSNAFISVTNGTTWLDNGQPYAISLKTFATS